jgi:hypothetical protein
MRYDEDIIKAGRQYIHRTHSYDKEIAAAQKKQINETYLGRINRAKTAEESYQIIQDLLRTPMDEGLRATLLAKARKGVPYADRDDPEAMARYRAKASTLTADEAYNEFKPSFTKKTMDGIIAVKQKKGAKRVEGYQDGFALELESLYKNKQPLVRKTNIHAMTTALDEFVWGYLEENQENPSKKEMDEYKQHLLTEEVYDYGFWNWGDRKIAHGLIPTLEAEDIDVEYMEYEDIPEAEVRAIQQMYVDKKIGRVPSQDEIKALYIRGLIDRTR